MSIVEFLCSHKSLHSWASEFRAGVAASNMYDSSPVVDQQAALSLMEVTRRGVDATVSVSVVFVHWIWSVNGLIVRPSEKLGRIVDLTHDGRVLFSHELTHPKQSFTNDLMLIWNTGARMVKTKVNVERPQVKAYILRARRMRDAVLTASFDIMLPCVLGVHSCEFCDGGIEYVRFGAAGSK
jgi:hypothetical protein